MPKEKDQEYPKQLPPSPETPLETPSETQPLRTRPEPSCQEPPAPDKTLFKGTTELSDQDIENSEKIDFYFF